jgi:polysaccharide export outer membrane protein
MRPNHFLVVLLAALAVTGCVGHTAQTRYRYAPVEQAYQAPAAAAQAYAVSPTNPTGVQTAYTLDAGDRLRIKIFGQQGLTNSYVVDPAGNVTMPLVGPVPARGLSTEQLSRSIAERLRLGSVREPHVAVETEGYRPFFIGGAVAMPGAYAYVPNMTAENAVAMAGGFRPRADKNKVTLTRNQFGQALTATVAANYPIRPGDTLRIQERWF